MLTKDLEDNWEILCQKADNVEEETFWESACNDSYLILLSTKKGSSLDSITDKEDLYNKLIGFTNKILSKGAEYQHPFLNVRFFVKEVDHMSQRILVSYK